MKVKNITQLRELVDKSGMAVDEQGRVGAKPAPAPIPTAPPELMAAIVELTAAVKQPQRIVVPSPVVESKTPQTWVFTIERGFDGLMTKITAQAK